MKTPIKNKSNENQQGNSKGNQSIKAGKEALKSRGISNSGGQMSYHTDNKQATVNKGNENSMVQGKTKAPKMPSKHSPKKG
ncbi:hypothetical protein [Daejeonella sp. H1SJ63]|jgi:hypothetical protein|uniref:hypothetical protein n=1 Tax=Daejeonella sp. H1SJ63 TaxID=3034145 RepID=UPI0023EE15E4|nr:hypothetical protein [Daejeonella sp. H1SJ63]